MATLTFVNRTHFDHGAISQLSSSLEALGIRRPLLCTDPGLVAAGIVDIVEAEVPAGTPVTRFAETPENPTEAAVRAALERYREADCDGIVALGGGSSMDLAKAVALAATHADPLIEYTAGRGGMERIGAVAPLLAIPTTAGTGSEVSSGAVVIMDSGEKLILASRHLVPPIALCDPDLTLGLPARLTAATGMDAVTHCIEAVLSPVVNPPAEAVGLDGLRRALGERHLHRAVADGQDRDARWHMMMASNEGALAFSKGLGAVHAMSHAAGARGDLRLHHGTLNALFLPTILRFNADACADKYERIREAVRLPDGTDLADFVEALNAELGLPARVSELGVTAAMIPELARHAAQDVCTFTNPKPCDEGIYARLFEEAL